MYRQDGGSVRELALRHFRDACGRVGSRFARGRGQGILRSIVIATEYGRFVGGERGAPEADQVEVRVDVLRWVDERAVARVLARAFLDDPLVVAICGGSRTRRARRLWWSFRVAVRSHCRARQPAWTLSDGSGVPVAVALVTRPPVPVAPIADGWFALWGLLRVGLGATRRSLIAARAIASQEPAPPFTYLRTLAVDPAWQRRHLGSRLVAHVQRTATRTLPIYLETSRAENVGFYQHFGFELIGEFSCLDVPLWRLLCPAAATAGVRV